MLRKDFGIVKDIAQTSLSAPKRELFEIKFRKMFVNLRTQFDADALENVEYNYSKLDFIHF
jgi:hypothetical protein